MAAIADLTRGVGVFRGGLDVERLGESVSWFDAGTAHALLQAANYVHSYQERHGRLIGDIDRFSPRSVKVKAGVGE